MAARRRGNTDGRHVDWSGINEQVTLSAVAPLVHMNLWQPVVELERATVTRIRGCINFEIAPEQLTGSHVAIVSVGVQVVNRAQGTSGTARDPSNVDDLEGGEWLYLRQHVAAWTITGSVGTPPDAFIANGGDILSGYNADVDIKAQRIIDLSQDELLLSFAISVTGSDTVTARAHMRLLLKYG